jgi:hypothetical protein
MGPGEDPSTRAGRRPPGRSWVPVVLGLAAVLLILTRGRRTDRPDAAGYRSGRR